MRLLANFNFDRTRDQLWFAGDLINRGPDNLSVLRYVRSLGSAAKIVLGNHDLHLIARFHHIMPYKERDTLGDVLSAPDAPELIDWLATQPLTVHQGRFFMVHAGIKPQWTIDEATAQARRLEGMLKQPNLRQQLLSPATKPTELRVLTTMRTCHDDGSLCDYSGPPANAPKGCLPWFAYPHKRGETTVIFGHWSSLGFYQAPGLLGLDSGCIWGQKLTAVRLEDQAVFQQPTIDKIA